MEEEGYAVTTAGNGLTALARLTESAFDLILLDVMMPGMDGYEVTQKIRENPDILFVPILLITAHDSPNVAHGLDLGADDFIRKPVTVDELLARVRSLVRLKHSIDERDEIDRQRQDFVSRLTHDLRTPLVAAERMMMLFLEGALGELSPSMAEAMTILARSNSNLLSMVNTLLEVYRFEAGRKNLTFQAVEIKGLITEVADELTPLAEGKKLNISTENKEIKNTIAMGDRLELHRLFTNLVGNAIKFTDSGSITLRLAVPNHGDDYIKIEVADTGQGIPVEEQATLFERFRPGSHKRSGSGLGLYLSRRIVEAHQGTIQVSSEPGKGSVFTVDLPVKQE
ncbi:two-component hybrid sensor and regulator [Richelia intracellularis]|nr:two-component hybrid sensor and regulator [Richelia intracellularis]